MKPATRALLFFAGSFGTAGAALSLLVGVAFCTLINPAFPPDERRRQFFEEVFIDNAVGFSFYFLLFNGSLLLCVKSVANRAKLLDRTGLHLLVSSLIAAAVVVLMLVPFLLRF